MFQFQLKKNAENNHLNDDFFNLKSNSFFFSKGKNYMFVVLLFLFQIGFTNLYAQCPTSITGGPTPNSNGFVCNPGSYTFTGGVATSTWTEVNAVTNTIIQTVTGPSISVNWTGLSGQRQIKLEDYNSPCSYYSEQIFTIQTPSLTFHSSGVGYTIIEFLPVGSNVQSWSASDPGVTNWNDIGADHNVFYNVCQTGTYSVDGTSNGGCYVSGSFSVSGLEVSISGPSTVGIGSTITLVGSQAAITSSTWSSSNTSVATVDGSGNVLGVSAGSTTITYEVTYTYTVTHPTAGPQTKTAVCSATKIITVANTCNAVADAGSNSSLDCNNTSTSIGASAVGGFSYSWSPSTGLSSSTISNPTASPSVTTIYTLTVTDNSNPSCTATDEVTVTVDNTPPTANAGNDGSIDCNTSSISIGVSTGGGNSYSWSPATGLSNSNAVPTNASPASTTTYTLFVTGANGCTATDEVTVTVDNTPPTANAGNDGSIDCNTTSVSIGVSTGGGNSYSWSPATGLSNSNTVPTNASPASTTTYTLFVTGSNGCTATDEVTVTVDNTPPTANAGNDGSIDCNTTSVSIGVSTGGGNSYSWSPATGLSNSNTVPTNASPASTTTYTLFVTGSNGCTATDEVTVTVNNTPPTANAGNDGSIDCNTTSVSIGVSTGGGNSYSWSPATGLSNSNTVPTNASPASTTTYTLFVTGSNGCTATDEVTITVDNTPPTANAGNDGSIDCNTTSVSIGVSTGGGNSYSWSPATGLSNSNTVPTNASPSSTTTYTLFVTGSNGCTATDEVTVTVDNTPPTANAGNDVTLDCVTTSAMIGTASVFGNSYNWSPSLGLNNPSIAQPIANPSVTTIYTVTVIGANGCTSTNDVVVTINANLGTIGNYVWEDKNHNGINDEANGYGINGVSVELWNATTNTLVASTQTSNNINGNPGYYSFSTCVSGNYFVKFPMSHVGKQITLQTTTAGTDGNSDASEIDGKSPVFSINVNGVGVAKDNNTIDAGYYFNKAQLGNYVWNDIDKDGSQEIGEVGVAGITVTLYNNSNSIVASTITDAYGYYVFNPISAGTYHVGFTLPTNYQFSNQNTVGDLLDSDVDPVSGLTSNYVINVGDSNMSVDAGIYFEQPTVASLGNYVWFDQNADGIQDANEQGISGVTVSLYNNSNVVLATVITDASGFYNFNDLVPGIYYVGFTQPVGLTFSPNNGIVSLPSNSDVNPSTGMTTAITVNAGDEITYVDAGLFTQPVNNGGIGDRVWYDVNQNGLQDATETGVRAVTVTLYQGNGTTVLATTQTDMFGDYIFNNLPQGDYVVGFSTLPSNYIYSPQGQGSDSTINSDVNPATGKTNVIHLAAGQYNLTYDAGIYTTVVLNNNSIGNYVWNDIDKDGIQDASEQGVAGITATLYNSSNVVVGVTSSDENGFYLFPDLPNGDYYVNFSNLPNGYVFSIQSEPSATNSTDSDPNTSTGSTTTVSLTGNTHNLDLDAGINFGGGRVVANLGDIVWYDMNNNGLQDASESGVSGVTVTLYEQNGTTVISTTTTDALGNYIFTSLDAGSYVVGFSNLPVGYSISPYNADGQGINGEINSDVIVLTQKTAVIALGTGEDKMSVDMGIVPPVGSASLGNRVWFDLNNDGLQSPGEPGVQGVGVALLNVNNEVISTSTTNENGEYYFVGLIPATYSVEFSNLPNGYTFTTQNIDLLGINGVNNSDANSLNGITNTVTLSVGENNLNLDAGIVSSTVASVGDYVWYDINQDGIQDTNEPGISGVLVTLYDNSNVAVASTITNPDGSYIFTNVTPGSYTMGFSNLPTSMVFTQQIGDANSNINSNVIPTTGLTLTFVVVAGTHNPTIDAGLTTPINAGLGNYVWNDFDLDGLQDPTESGVPGILVTLYNTSNEVLATAVTDGNGAYGFANLAQGSYIIGFGNIPVGYSPTVSTGVLNDALNSDMDPATKLTGVIVLSAGTFNPNIDAGIFFGFPLPAKEFVATFVKMNDANHAQVNWYTKDEVNTSKFEIERSIDGHNYVKVGQLSASVSSSDRKDYAIVDDIASVKDVEVIYYRIKLVDIDGNHTVSNIISVRPRNISTNEMLVYPVPFVDHINIDYMAEEETSLTIVLTDLAGKIIKSNFYELQAGNNYITIMDMAQFSSGTYYMKTIDVNTGEIHLVKIVK